MPNKKTLFYCLKGLLYSSKLLILVLFICSQPTLLNGQKVIQKIIKDNPFLKEIINNKKHQVQIIYTQINRNQENQPKFKSYTLGVDPDLYFYPASTVKMPAAILALEKVNSLERYNMYPDATMITRAERSPQTPVREDTTAQYGQPSISHYIKKIFLVSDNDAYNRLYEFLGQQYLNERLYEKGYQRSRIVHRLSNSKFDAEANKYTNPLAFYNNVGNIIYAQSEVYSEYPYQLDLKGQVRGKGYMNNEGTIVDEAFDFRVKNYMALQDLHDILKAVLFPDMVPEKSRFNLKAKDYDFLYKYMSMLPGESDYPKYNPYDYWDSYVKFFMFGDKRTPMPDNIRIFNKVGDAYGFLTDIAYVVDFEKQVEFILAVNIHVNENEIFNDGEYEYDSIGFPFLGQLGRAVYDYELKRKRKVKPDLSRFQIDY